MRPSYRRAPASRRELLWYGVLLSVILLVVIWAPSARASSTRQWHVAYNPHLALHSCACPATYSLGDRLRITYHGKTWKVLVTDTGPYFDISSGGMNHLASTGAGVVVAKVMKL